MKTSHVRRQSVRIGLASLVTASAATVGLQAPSSQAAASLGGFDGMAVAQSVRVMLFEPSIPIPAEPQGDVGIGFTRSTTTTGPSSRALASYVWPGDALGDGLGILVDPRADYPVKVNSRFPATPTAPDKNRTQISDRNGMSTQATETLTESTVTGLGVAGPSPLGGVGAGLCNRVIPDCPESPDNPVPVEVAEQLAALVTSDNIFSRSTVERTDESLTSVAQTRISGTSLLGGLITLDHLDLRVTSTSDGVTSKVTGRARISGLQVAGQEIEIARTVKLAGQEQPAPELPVNELKQLGIGLDYLTTVDESSSDSGAFAAQALTVSIDLATLRDLLGLSPVSGPLADALEGLPDIGPLVGGLARLGSKLAIVVGDVRASTRASEAFVPDPIVPPDEVPTTDPDDGDSAAPSGPSGAAPIPDLGGLTPPSTPAPGATTDPGTTPTTEVTTTPVSNGLPALGEVPRMLLLLGLVLAGAFGWLFRGMGSLLLAAPSCAMGLKTGVPDLRKG